MPDARVQAAIDHWGPRFIQAGVDANVALLRVGASGEIDTNTVRQDVVGFVLTNAGLMASANLEGSKITRLDI